MELLASAHFQETLDLYLADLPPLLESEFFSIDSVDLENMNITPESFKDLSMMSSGRVSFDTEQGLENLMACVPTILDIKARTDLAWQKTKKYADLIQDKGIKAFFEKCIRDLAHVEWIYGLEKDDFLERAMADVIGEESDEKITDDDKQVRLLYFIQVMEHMSHSKTNPYDLASLKRLVERRFFVGKDFDSTYKRWLERQYSFNKKFITFECLSRTVNNQFYDAKKNIREEMRINHDIRKNKRRLLHIAGLAIIGLSLILDACTTIWIDPSYLVFFSAFYLLLFLMGVCMIISSTFLNHTDSVNADDEKEKKLCEIKKELWETCFLEKVPENQKTLTKKAVHFLLEKKISHSDADGSDVFLDDLTAVLVKWGKDGQFAPERIHAFNSIVFYLKRLEARKDTEGAHRAWQVFEKQVREGQRLDFWEVLERHVTAEKLKQKMDQLAVDRPRNAISQTVGFGAISRTGGSQQDSARLHHALDLETKLVTPMYRGETKEERSARLAEPMYENETKEQEWARQNYCEREIKKRVRL